MTAVEFLNRSGYVTPDGRTESMPLTVKAEPAAPNTGLGGADSQYGKRFRRVNDGLSTCGISHLIDTPKIAIMGSQSAGKSSVMESISKIPFPRSSGTCTRCPTEVRLYNKKQDWTCSVSLRIENDAQGHPLPKPKIIPFGEPLGDLSLVQQRISAAQRAILNPSKSAQSFISDGPSEEENEISFSENTICLDVRGDDLVDLTIIDLPGIIANTGDGEDASSIELIKNLVRKTISMPNCLILSTITMSEDYQNQIGVMLAKEADPKGTRTLGVLTKPDRIDKGDFEQWTPLLKGQINRLLHGYYVLKNPSSEELKKKLTHKETRANEAAFFQQEPWRSLGAAIGARLGSQKLAQRLEGLLEKLIQDKLPQTIAQIHAMSQETNEKLRALPVKITDQQATQKLFAVCQSFSQVFQKEIENDGVDEPVLFGWPLRTYMSAFRDMAYKSRPLLLPYTEPEMDTSDYLSDSSSDDEDDCDTEGEGTERVVGSKFFKGVPKAKVVTVSKVTAGAKLLTKSDPTPFRITLDLVKDAMDAATRDRLPGNVPFAVKEKLMKQAVDPLEGFAWDYFNDVVSLLKRVATTLVANHLKQRYESLLPDMMLNSLIALIDHQTEFCRHLIAQLIATEHGLIFTLNNHYYLDKRDDFCKRLCQQRIERKLHGGEVDGPSVSISGRTYCIEDSVVEFLQEQNISVNKLSDLAEHRIPAEIRERIMLAAEVRAYWQVAFKRFIDNVCATIHVHLIKPIAERCFAQMCEDLGVLGSMTADKAVKLLQHPESVRQEREDLEASKQRLDSALKVIEDFHRGRFD